MQPLIPLQEQDRAKVEAGYEEEYSSSDDAGRWGGLVLLAILIAALAAAIWFFGSMDGIQAPADPAPSEAPLDPGY